MRRFHFIAITIAVVSALLIPLAGTSATASPQPPKLTESQSLLVEIMGSPTMRGVREALPEDNGTESVTSAELAAAITSLPTLVAGMTASDNEEGAALDVLRSYLGRPDVSAALALASQYRSTNNTDVGGVDGSAVIAAAVHTVQGLAFQRISIWAKIGTALILAGTAVATLAACVGTFGLGCALAIGAFVLIVAGTGVIYVDQAAQDAAETEGSAAFNGSCKSEGTCVIEDVTFQHPSQTAARVDITFRPIKPDTTTRTIGAQNSGCPTGPLFHYTPVTGSDLTDCFAEVLVGPAHHYPPSGRSVDLWIDNSSAADYAFMVCSPHVFLEAVVTWANGHKATHGVLVPKPTRVC